MTENIGHKTPVLDKRGLPDSQCRKQHEHQLINISSLALQSHRGRADGPRWIPVHTEGCVTGKKPQVYRIWVFYSRQDAHLPFAPEKYIICIILSSKFVYRLLQRQRNSMSTSQGCFLCKHPWKVSVEQSFIRSAGILVIHWELSSKNVTFDSI